MDEFFRHIDNKQRMASPVPRALYYIPTQIITKSVDSLLPIVWLAGIMQPSHLMLRSQVSKWTVLLFG